MVQRIVHWYRGWFIGTGDGELVQKKVQAGRDKARTDRTWAAPDRQMKRRKWRTGKTERLTSEGERFCGLFVFHIHLSPFEQTDLLSNNTNTNKLKLKILY